MLNDAPLLTVIVTSYNVESYLEDSLDTIMQQTLQDIEIVVVDDGSTDRSPEIIRARAERDPRIVPVLLPENSPGGVGTAANAGLDRARGIYVGFADGDDLYDLTMFEKLVEAARAEDADLALCKYELLEEVTGRTKQPAEAGRWKDVGSGTYSLDPTRTRQFLRFIAVPWRKIYRRTLLEENAIRFPVGDWFYEDNPFHWFSVISADSIAVVPEVLCWHRVGREGQTMQTADERLFKIFQHHDTIRTWLKARGLEKQYRPNLLAWTLSQMEWISAATPESLRRRLFDELTRTLRPYAKEDYANSYAESGRGERGRALAEAVRRRNFREFVRILENRPRRPSLVPEGVSRLRTEGVVPTARLAIRYFQGRRASKSHNSTLPPAASNVRPANGSPTNDDLAFALMVLDRRIKRLEADLASSRRLQEKDWP